MKHTDTILAMYEAFGRGDVEGILSKLTDDVTWVCNLGSDVPWSGNYSGKAEVPQFFSAIFEACDVTNFEPLEFVADGDVVVSTGTFGCTVKSTGAKSLARWVFLWRFRGDLVCGYEQFHGPELEAAFSAA